MQITIARDDLAEALGAAIGVVEARTTIPILANVLLTADHGRLRIRATDLDMEIDLAAQVTRTQTEGSVTVPAAVLHQLVRKFPAGAEIGLTLMADRGRLRVACGRAHYDLPVLPADDFPLFGDNLIGGMPIEAQVLKRALTRVRFAMSTEETRYYLNGVFLHREDERLMFVATDGHVLAREAVPLPPQAGEFPGVILPRKFVGEALRLLPDTSEGEDCHLVVTERRVALFLPDGTRLASKLIEGTYPDYKRVIPAGHPHTAELPRAALAAAIERAAVMLERKGGNGLRLAFGPGTLALSGYTEAKGYASERLDIRLDSGPARLEIGVNAGLLADVVARFGGDTLFMSFGDASAPMLFRDGAEEGPALAVVMPMRLNAMPAELAEAA